MVVKIDKATQARPIEWLARDDRIMAFLRDAGFKTVGDVVAGQSKIPDEYWLEIKRKLVFGI